MVTLDHLHHILLYAALTDLKTNIQIGVDDSAYIWVRAVQFHGALHQHRDGKNEIVPFHLDGSFYKDKPIITACLAIWRSWKPLLHKIQKHTSLNLEKTS